MVALPLLVLGELGDMGDSGSRSGKDFCTKRRRRRSAKRAKDDPFFMNTHKRANKLAKLHHWSKIRQWT